MVSNVLFEEDERIECTIRPKRQVTLNVESSMFGCLLNNNKIERTKSKRSSKNYESKHNELCLR